MDSEQIRAEAKRRFDAMDPQEKERETAELRRKLELLDEGLKKGYGGNPYSDSEAKKEAKQGKTIVHVLGAELDDIRNGGSLMERSELGVIEEMYGLNKDQLRTADPNGGRERIRQRLIRWLEGFLVVAAAFILPIVLPLRGGWIGYVVYVIFTVLFVLSVRELVKLVQALKWDRVYRKLIRKLNDPAFQEQEVQREVKTLLLAQAQAQYDAAKAENQAAGE